MMKEVVEQSNIEEGARMERSLTPGNVACREQHSTGYMSGVSIESNVQGKIGVHCERVYQVGRIFPGDQIASRGTGK